MTGSNLQYEIMTGAFERILATQASRSALMMGRALKELIPLVASATIITLVTIPFGFLLEPAARGGRPAYCTAQKIHLVLRAAIASA
jgi:ABC-2 type transport system permease protein